METPINDFLDEYNNQNPIRLHMPGHKGIELNGFEKCDITEVFGADNLYDPDGVIAQSERNASKLFDTGATFYGVEGSSQIIKSMLFVASQYGKMRGKANTVVAARNVHKSFVSAAALIGFTVDWLMPKDSNYLSCEIDLNELEYEVAVENAYAVYITSPDYLGNVADIAAIAEICRRYDALLIVDNAHGSYLNFLEDDSDYLKNNPKLKHPMKLGADMCSDSAHKTLPVLTGGAYFHIAKDAQYKDLLIQNVKNSMMLFGSTSPSYLIMKSLDKANEYLADGYREKLAKAVERVGKFKSKLNDLGYTLAGDEPLKVTIDATYYGYTGIQIAEILRYENVEIEFADPDFVVMMMSAEFGDEIYEKLLGIFEKIPKKDAIPGAKKLPKLERPRTESHIYDAVYEPWEEVSVDECEDKVLSELNVACPPAVPIVVCGELMGKNHIEYLKYYGVKTCKVFKNRRF